MRLFASGCFGEGPSACNVTHSSRHDFKLNKTVVEEEGIFWFYYLRKTEESHRDTLCVSRRAVFIPARIICSIILDDSDEGPMVQTILVLFVGSFMSLPP